MKKLLLFCSLILLGNSFLNAQLVAGDIAIIGVNEDPGPTAGQDHSFAWIALTDISGGQVIYFTEQGWNDNNVGTTQGFWMENSEGHYSWTAPSGGLTCGSIIHIYESGSTNVLTAEGGGTMSGLLSGTGWNLSSGDQVIAYTSSAGAKPAGVVPTFIAAIHMDDSQSVSIGWDPITTWSSASYTSSGVAASHVPPGLTNGTDCIALHNPNDPAYFEVDNAKYTGSLTGTSSNLRGQINTNVQDGGSWSRDNDSPFNITPAAYSPNVTCASPCAEPTVPTVTSLPTTVCDGSTTTLTISGSLNAATNWHIYTGSCGGTQIGTTAGSSFTVTPTSPSTTYYVRGEGDCVTPGSCGQTTVTVTALDNAEFSYSASAYCVNDADPTPTITGLSGGSFSRSPSGLIINVSTGEIDVSTSSPNSYTVTYTTAGTCPNSSNVNVTIHNTSSGTDTQTACDTYTWIDSITYTSSNNTATDTLINAIGCDSIVTLNLTINNSTTGTDTQTACDTYTWIDGITYTSSNNTVTDTLINAVGCDSIVTLNLTINNTTTGTDTQTACDTYTWIDGITYTSSNNTATDTLINAVGCDSIVTLNLTINNTTTGTDTQTACDTYTWIDGITYTSSNNTVTDTLINAVGCDSIVTLNLTINNSTTGTDTQTACDTYTWIDGITYTSSNNTATDTLINILGCDSIVTLNLTINDSVTYDAPAMVECDSAEINGNWYYSSQTVTDVFIGGAVNGCDSIVFTELTIHSLCCDNTVTICQTPIEPPGLILGLSSDKSIANKVYDNFSGIVGGITNVKWWGSTGDAGSICTENPKNFEISFYHDNGGVPGTLISSYNVLLSGVATGSYFGSLPVLKYSLELPSPFYVVPSGWISIQGSPAGSCEFYWITSPHGDGKAYVEGSKGLITDDLSIGITADPSIPLSNWAIYIGVVLIGGLLVVRYRKLKHT